MDAESQVYIIGKAVCTSLFLNVKQSEVQTG